MKRDTLDTAIDETAARMVAVPDDPEIVMRIVSALPERSSRLGWLIPQFAVLSAIAIAAVVWSARERPAAPAVLPSIGIATVMAFPGAVLETVPVTARAPETVRTVLVERLELVDPMEPGDFERALPALETAEALELNAIGPKALPAVEALALAPIGIGELTLTAEAISPNQFE